METKELNELSEDLSKIIKLLTEISAKLDVLQHRPLLTEQQPLTTFPVGIPPLGNPGYYHPYPAYVINTSPQVLPGHPVVTCFNGDPTKPLETFSMTAANNAIGDAGWTAAAGYTSKSDPGPQYEG